MRARRGSGTEVAVRATDRISVYPPAPLIESPYRAADAIVDALASMGVTTFFGVPGGAISPIYDALFARPDLRVIHARHETAALFMCLGWWRLRPEEVPCVLVTSGPGITNAVTGMAAALAEQVPVIVIGGEVPRSKFGRGALQEGSQDALDVLGIVRSVTRSAERLTVGDQARFQTACAVVRARERRGPVFLSLPLDVGVARTFGAPPIALPRRAPAATSPLLAAAARAIESAQRPLVLAGSGALHASDELRRFVERLGLPVITSPKAKGVVPENARYCLGVFGYGGHPSALDWLHAERPDVTLALGCGFSEPSTNSWSALIKPTRCLIQVDLDAQQMGRAYAPDIPIVMDCQDAIAALDELLADAPARADRWDGIHQYEPHRLVDDGLPLGHARALRIVQEELPSDTVYTIDIGEHLLFAIHYLRLARPDQLVVSYSLGSMGSGLVAAVGAKLAAPERTVVAVCGDYGFQMYGMELNTCVQERVGTVFLIMNDHRMRMVEAGVQRNYGRCVPMDGPRVDFAALARSHGALGFVVETANDLRSALRNRAEDSPTVIDVRVDPGARFPVNPREQEISNFTAR